MNKTWNLGILFFYFIIDVKRKIKNAQYFSNNKHLITFC